MHRLTRETDILLTKLVDYPLITFLRTKNSHFNNNDVSLRKILFVDHMRDLLIEFIYYSSYSIVWFWTAKDGSRPVCSTLPPTLLFKQLLERICFSGCPRQLKWKRVFVSLHTTSFVVTNRSQLQQVTTNTRIWGRQVIPKYSLIFIHVHITQSLPESSQFFSNVKTRLLSN